MPKEALFEDLVKRAAGDVAEGGGGASEGFGGRGLGEGSADGDKEWHYVSESQIRSCKYYNMLGKIL